MVQDGQRQLPDIRRSGKGLSMVLSSHNLDRVSRSRRSDRHPRRAGNGASTLRSLLSPPAFAVEPTRATAAAALSGAKRRGSLSFRLTMTRPSP